MCNLRSILAAGVLATFLGGLVLSAGCGRRAPLDADAVLRRMSDALAGAQRLSFTARREADPDLRQGRDLAAQTTITIRLARPQRIAVELESGSDRRAMYADGTTFTLQDVAKNLYSTTPLNATLDDLDQQLDRIYGFVPPTFEFVTNHPYESIHARVNSLTLLGESSDSTGVRCYHLTAAGDVADAELWVGVADFLPRQLIATFRTVASHPQVRLYFSAWNLTPAFPDSALAFSPPAGAMKIPMRSVAEMQEMIRSQKR